MRIIIEGPDGSGKTQLVNKILETYRDITLVERHCNPDGPTEELAEWVENSWEQSNKANLLYDRHPMISEPIYSPALGRPLASRFNDPEWLMAAYDSFRSQHPWVIYCLPSREQVIRNVEATHGGTDHQDAIVRNIGTIYDLYVVDFCKFSYNPGVNLTWDYTRMRFNDLASAWLDSFFERK